MGEVPMDTGVTGEERGGSSPFSPSAARRQKPRLFIKEMVLRNFKSYAGEQRIGPFHKSFSAVVGPNGSGKSNVIDSMLFVFGKRAKQMRLNKVSELIHNSSNHQNLDSAGVSVHFQEIIDLDDGSYEAVEGSDFTITRVAFRDNSSKYYINDRTSNFTEVTKKLKGKGVDLDNNRFLILQGEVEQISLMKPKSQGPHDEGFLEYLEDIIGTDKYVEKIDEAFKQLEVLNEKRSGAVQMVKLAEKERESLESVKDEAEAFMLKELLHLKWQEKANKLASQDASSNVAQYQESVSNIETGLANDKQKIKENEKELKELEKVFNMQTKKQEELDKDLRNCQEQFKEFERREVKHNEDFKHLEQKIKKLEGKIEKDNAKIVESNKEIEESNDLIPKLEEKLPKLQEELIKEEKILEEIKESSLKETEKFRVELAKVREELEPWETQLIEHKGKLNVATGEKKILIQKHDSARLEYTNAQKQIEEMKEKINTKTNEITEIKSKIDKTRTEASEFRKIEAKCLKKEEELSPREQAATQKVAEMRGTLESEKSQGTVLKELIRAKDSNEIVGIIGRLGDLGAIDAKYDIAISTACAGLDYILVETAEAAQACVDLLRQKKLGIATCMILEKQRHHERSVKERVNTPEGAPRLFDLVKVKEERFKTAFYACLRNTVVATDLDQATRISYAGNREFGRVVTLKGELMEKVGTMTGGGGRGRGGKMGSQIKESVSPGAVETAQRELDELASQLNELRQTVRDARKRYGAAESGLGRLNMELAKCQKEVESLSEQYSYNEKRLDSLRVASEPKKDELSRIQELEEIISSEKIESDKLTKASSKLKNKASELQSRIENAGGEKLKNQKAKFAKIQSEIDKTSTEINRHKVRVTTCEKLLMKLSKGLDESNKEREKLMERKEQMDSESKESTNQAFSVKEKYIQIDEVLKEHQIMLNKTKGKFNELKKTMDELRHAELRTDIELKDQKKTLKEWEMKVKDYSKKLEEINANLAKQMEQIQTDAVDPDKLEATLSDNSLNEEADLKKAAEMVALLRTQLKEMNPNLDSIAEYRKKTALYNGRVNELNAATQERDDLKKHYEGLKKQRLEEFMAGFNTISMKLKEMYQMITLGGDAELELVDSLDPFSEGVVFSVRPPKKSWKNIANLSGGEKTLSSLALVFALHHYKPTPLYVMDEIDAALDFKNVSIVGHYVKDRTKDAQFIIISLRNNMFELADTLVGIYKTDNCTKSITINPGSFEDCIEESNS